MFKSILTSSISVDKLNPVTITLTSAWVFSLPMAVDKEFPLGVTIAFAWVVSFPIAVDRAIPWTDVDMSIWVNTAPTAVCAETDPVCTEYASPHTIEPHSALPQPVFTSAVTVTLPIEEEVLIPVTFSLTFSRPVPHSPKLHVPEPQGLDIWMYLN